MEVKKMMLVGLALMVLLSIATAAVVTYLSNSAIANVSVESPIQLDKTSANINGVEVNPNESILLYANETITFNNTLTNKSRVAQSGITQLVISPAVEATTTTEGATITQVEGATVVTYNASTVPTDDVETEEAENVIADAVNLTVGNIEPTSYTFTFQYNVNEAQ